MMRKRVRKVPTERDLEVFHEMDEDLLDYLYGGLSGRFQIAGHKIIDRWMKSYKNKIVLEVGCGHGHHLLYGGNQYTHYVGLDIERKFLETLKDRFPGKMMVNGDAYALPFRNASVDCVLSVYNLEHLHHLSDSLSEIRRVLKSDGELLVGLPAEGGLLYGLGRRLTSKRYIERKYNIDYDAIVHWEHWNTFNEVMEALRIQFVIEGMRFIPFSFLPIVHVNIIGCVRARPM
jgi:SAM-dependent methyltransferase